MGQNLFGRHLVKNLYPQKADNSYESKHHKENYGVNGKTTLSMTMDDVPPNKKRRVFPSAADEVSHIKQEPVFSLRNPVVSEPSAPKKSRLRKYGRTSQEQQQPPNSSAEAKPLAEKRVNRSSPRDHFWAATKLLDRNNNAFHELRSSKKCSWIKQGIWTTQASNFIPPSCPAENLTTTNSLSLRSAEKASLVEVPLFRRNPIRPLAKVSPQLFRLNGLTNKGIKSKGKQTNQLVEDTSDDCFCRRHRKSEDLEKRIVRWDRQRQRELEYYEYLKQREAQRKTSHFAPNLQFTSSINSAASSVASPSTKPQAASTNVGTASNDASLWPSVENIQFIEILPSNRSLVQVTLFGQPLPSVDTKAAFALPWSVNPSVTAPSNSSQKASSNSTSRRKPVAKRPTTTMRKKVNAAKAKVIKASRRKEENSKPSTSTARRRSTTNSPPSTRRRSFVSRSLSLPLEKSCSPKQLESMLMTRNGLYAKPKPREATGRRLSVPARRRSLRIR